MCPRSQLVSGGGASLKPTPEPVCFTPALHNLEMFIIPIILIPHSKHLQIHLIFLPFTHFTQIYFSLHCHHLRKFWFSLLPSTLHMTPKINPPKILLSSHPTCSDPSTAPFHLQSEAHAPLGPSLAGPVPTVSPHAAHEPSPPVTWSPHPPYRPLHSSCFPSAHTGPFPEMPPLCPSRLCTSFTHPLPSTAQICR